MKLLKTKGDNIMAVEEHVKGLMTNKIITTQGYAKEQDKTTKDGVTWYKEQSYQHINPVVEAMLSDSSKSLTGQAGTPDFLIDTPNYRIVIEAKGIEPRSGKKHSRYSDVKNYIKPTATRDDEVYDVDIVKNRKCPIDEALYYATFLNSDKDVIAIGISGTQNDSEFRFTSFLLPRGENLSKISLLEDGGLNDTFNSVEDYQRQIYKIQGFEEKLYRLVYEDLRIYADDCAKFLNTNGIDENDRLGLVSAIILALTNKDSALYQKVHLDTGLKITSNEIKDALLSSREPKGIIVEDKLSAERQNILETYFVSLLNKPSLNRNVKVKDNKEVNTKPFFIKHKGKADTILSRLTYSLNENIVDMYDKYQSSNVDVMGSFYSLFLQYVKADVKKGVVLTPRHITDLFCDIAEYYLEEKLTDKTKIVDIATGSGGFLISALNRMNNNIDNDSSLNQSKKEELKYNARTQCLIGIELKEAMYVLAYANMRFHKDGKSSLYQGSGLYSDKDIMKDNKTFYEITADYYNGDDKDTLTIEEKVEKAGYDVGMMNPPYEEDVFEFIDSMLMYLRKGGIGIAIVPINTQATNTEVTAKKNKILSNNTLLASILMPSDLFNGVRGSGASTSTCILVFKAHSPHKDFVERGGLTYLADWSNDGFKLIAKHGRFEINNMWSDKDEGYKNMYLNDLKTLVGEKDFILSSDYKKDIHEDGAIKSIRKPIHKYLRTDRVLKYKTDGTPIYKRDRSPVLDENGNQKINIKGKPQFSYSDALDENGNKIQDYIDVEIFDNEDWNILEYVETDYNDLTEDDFVKTLLDYNLYLYMKDNDLINNDD